MLVQSVQNFNLSKNYGLNGSLSKNQNVANRNMSKENQISFAMSKPSKSFWEKLGDFLESLSSSDTVRTVEEDAKEAEHQIDMMIRDY